MKAKRSIFDHCTIDDLREFVALWKDVVDIQLDVDKAVQLALAAIKYYRGNVSMREQLRPMQELERRWYESLAKGSPDWGVYDDPFILSDIWSCWILYSRRYLLSLRKAGGLPSGKSIAGVVGSPNHVLDLGCGFGYTTAALKELFPLASVIGTNIEGCRQWRLAKEVGRRRGFGVASTKEALSKRADLIFASEYFEHIQDAPDHLTDLLIKCRPGHLIVANSFGTTSVGHFHEYECNVPPAVKGARNLLPIKGKVSADKVGKVFNGILKGMGYAREETCLWNRRPAWWKKVTG